MLLLGLPPAFLGLGLLFLALGARGTVGVSLYLGRTLLFVCFGLAAVSAILCAVPWPPEPWRP
jgi:hypothetical protein